jgi:hypothetical protein
MKSLILSITFFVVAIGASAQGSVTLLTFGGYTFADKFQTYYGYGRIEAGFQWGGGLEFEMRPNTAIELIYQRMDPDAYYDGDFSQRYTGQIGINYIMLGGTQYQPFNDVVSGFGSFDMGVAFTSNIDPSLSSTNVSRFALGGRLGLRIAPNDKVSLRVHAQLLSPVQWFGGGFYFGGGGGGTTVSTGSTIFQFSLGGSVNYRIR